jgi:hypothetical protein
MNIIKPRRAEHTFTQHLEATPDRVFGLLCPVREADWVQGWAPLLVVSESGIAERDCTFVTASLPSNSVWYIIRHEPEKLFVEMVKLSPGVTACRLTIQVRAASAGTSTAEVTYMHTSLGPEGDAFVEAFTRDHYARFMGDWEARLNYYLRHGSARPESA